MQRNFVVEPDLREHRTIVRKFSDEEKQAFANKAADLNQEIAAIEAEKKEKMAEFNEKIKSRKAERDSFTERREMGQEMLREMCEGHLEEHDGTWFMVFYDEYGTRVDDRHATPSERQTRLKTAVNE